MLGVLLYTAVLGAAALFVGPWLWTNVVLVVRRLWATRNIPEPPGYFLLGHIPVLLQSRSRSFRLFHKWSEQWPIFRIRFFGRPVSWVEGSVVVRSAAATHGSTDQSYR